jgi:glycerol uptake facilitator-like aquaporin
VSVIPFIVAQIVGALIACTVVRFLWPHVAEVASELVVPHTGLDSDREA